MKKFISLVLLLALAVSLLLLSGCNSSKNEGGQQVTTSNLPKNEESLASLFSRGQKTEGMAFDYVVTSNDQTINGKIWVSGDKVRTETVIGGKQIVSIMDGNAYYNYLPDQKKAMKMEIDKQNIEMSKTPLDYGKDIQTFPEKYKELERTTYDGVMCRVVSVTGADGKENMKMWVREDYGFPVRIETIEQDSSKTVIEYKNINIGKQAVETFQIPAGVTVTDVSSMLKGMSDKPSTGQ